jgi:CBS domain-containing protein
VRYTVVHAGEVKLVNLLPERTREGIGESIVDTLSRLRRTLGLFHYGSSRDPGGIRAMDLMRRNFTPIRADMHFEEVVHTFAEAPYDQYPVVDGEGVFLGVISFPEIRSILFDDVLEEVVVAADLITGPGVTCAPDTTLPEIIRIFEECHGEYSHLPVVDDRERPRVLGIVDQRGAMVAYRRHR